MDIFEAFATDKVAEVGGRWFPLSKTAKIKVARIGNPNYIMALRQRTKEDQTDFQDTSAEGGLLFLATMDKVYAESILVGWEGVKFKGQVLEYSFANAVKALSLKDFRKRVVDIAEKAESFHLKQEADQGNV